MSKAPSIIAALLMAAALSACAISPERYAEFAENREGFGTLVREDLAEASRSAHVHGDVVAFTCYDKLLEVLDRTDGGAFFTDPSKGVISTFQKARNTRRLLDTDVAVELRLACSALKEETESRIGAVIGFIRAL